jgi:hypothetical protein
VDENALAVYSAAAEALENLRYVEEERSAELDIILVDGESDCDPDLMADGQAR